MARVSIAMATYNGERYLREQLESFASQKLPPDELVVCDDASTDDTMEVLEAFRRKAKFEVRIERNPLNLGLIKNFEKALSLCTGDIIFFSDQDDVWFPEKIETVVARFAEEPEIQVIVNDQMITDENLKPSGFTKLGHLARLGLSESEMITGCCASFRSTWRDFCLPFPEGIPAHDNWVVGCATLVDARSTIASALQYFRRHRAASSNWILSEGRRIGSVELFLRQRSQQKSKIWEGELYILNQLRDRLSQNYQARSAFVGLIDIKIRNIFLRKEIAKSHLYIRPFLIFKLWNDGGYRAVRGLKSALSDLVR